MKLYHLASFTSSIPPEVVLGLSKACKKTPSGHNLYVNFVKCGREALCLCAIYEGAGWVLNFFRFRRFGFCALVLCAICYFMPCQSLGSFVVTVPCDAVLQICMQTLWISINGMLSPGKMTLSCNLVRVVSVESTGCFWVPRTFWLGALWGDVTDFLLGLCLLFCNLVCKMCSLFILGSCSACIKLLQRVQSNDASLKI